MNDGAELNGGDGPEIDPIESDAKVQDSAKPATEGDYGPDEEPEQ